MVIIRKQIRNAEQLEFYIKKYNAKNVYESVSTWLNPLNVRHKNPTRGYLIADYVLLDSMVFIDIDKQDKSEVLKVLEFFKDKEEYKLWKIVSSGGGFHVYYDDLGLKQALGKMHPKHRIVFLQDRRRALEEALIKAGIDLDKGILLDPFRISRVIGTWNGNKDAPCSEITLESLTAMTLNNTSVLSKSPRSRVRGPSIYLYKFISNMVDGLKDQYTTHIEITKNRDYSVLAKQLQKRYKVGTIYAFDTGNRIALISLKIFDRRRIEKILKYAKAENLNSFLKYGHSWIKLSETLTDKEIYPMNYLEMFYSETNGAFSIPHSKFIINKVGELGFNEMNHVMSGRENKVRIAKIKGAHV
jgi:hypothetical protein